MEMKLSIILSFNFFSNYVNVIKLTLEKLTGQINYQYIF